MVARKVQRFASAVIDTGRHLLRTPTTTAFCFDDRRPFFIVVHWSYSGLAVCRQLRTDELMNGPTASGDKVLPLKPQDLCACTVVVVVVAVVFCCCNDFSFQANRLGGEIPSTMSWTSRGHRCFSSPIVFFFLIIPFTFQLYS